MDYSKLEKLLSKKDFAQLTTNEQSWVLQHISQGDYERYRLTLEQSRKQLQNSPKLVQNPMSANLQAAFQAKYSKPSLGWQIIGWRIPFWPVVLAFALLLCWGWPRAVELPEPQTIIKTNQVYIPQIQTDTIYKERIIYKTKEVKVYLPQEATKPAKVNSDADLNPMPMAKHNTADESILDIVDLELQRKRGESVKGNEDLMDFWVRVN